MRTSAHLEAACPADDLFVHVESLDRYPAWMGLVHRAEPVVGAAVPTWDVELRARVGPLARSKRLRMVRTSHEPASYVEFVRREDDGRDHAAWELAVRIGTADVDGQVVSSLRVDLAYGGSLWTGGILQRVLDDEIGRARDRLLELVTSPTR